MLTTKSEILMAVESADSLLMILQSMYNGEIEWNVPDQTIDSVITGIRDILILVSHSLQAGYDNV